MLLPTLLNLEQMNYLAKFRSILSIELQLILQLSFKVV